MRLVDSLGHLALGFAQYQGPYTVKNHGIVNLFFSSQQYRNFQETATRLHQQDPKIVHYKGVKAIEYDCAFHQLGNFHVTDPSLVPCIAHDILSGLLEEDLAAIIKELVVENGLLTMS